MGRPKGSAKQTPAYRLHKASGQAVVTLPGVGTKYLGRYDSEESRSQYARLVAEWEARGRRAAPTHDENGTTVVELVAGFWQHLRVYYQRSPDSADAYRPALRLLRKMYGDTLADRFSPLCLLAVREAMLKLKTSRGTSYTRQTINRRLWQVSEAFRWGESRQLVREGVHHSLKTVEWLRRGHTSAPDNPPVRPVAEEHLLATLEFTPRVVRAMIQVQLFTSCRPGEVCVMRSGDFDTGPTGEMARRACPDCRPGQPCAQHSNWHYRPHKFKGQERDVIRVIPIGPKAQEIIRPFLRPDLSAYIFRPAETRMESVAARRMRKLTRFAEALAGKFAGGPFTLEEAAAAAGAAADYARARMGTLKAQGWVVASRGNPGGRWVYRLTPPERRGPLDVAGAMGRDEGPIKPHGRCNPRYGTDSYWEAVARACDLADAAAHQRRPQVPADQRLVPRWHPHQLRHNGATSARAAFTLDHARALCSHSSTDTTLIYAERDLQKANEVVARLG